MSGNTCCYVPRETNCGASPGRTWEPGHRSNSSGLKIMKFVGFCGVTNLETAMPADEATESPAPNSSERRDSQTLVWFHHGPSEFSRLALLCPRICLPLWKGCQMVPIFANADLFPKPGRFMPLTNFFNFFGRPGLLAVRRAIRLSGQRPAILEI